MPDNQAKRKGVVVFAPKPVGVGRGDGTSQTEHLGYAIAGVILPSLVPLIGGVIAIMGWAVQII